MTAKSEIRPCYRFPLSFPDSLVLDLDHAHAHIVFAKHLNKVSAVSEVLLVSRSSVVLGTASSVASWRIFLKTVSTF